MDNIYKLLNSVHFLSRFLKTFLLLSRFDRSMLKAILMFYLQIGWTWTTLQVVGPRGVVCAEGKSTHSDSRSNVERRWRIAEGNTWP